MASRATIGVLKILKSPIYRGRYTASRTPILQPAQQACVTNTAFIFFALIYRKCMFQYLVKFSRTEILAVGDLKSDGAAVTLHVALKGNKDHWRMMVQGFFFFWPPPKKLRVQYAMLTGLIFL